MKEGDRVRITGLPEHCGMISKNDSQFIGMTGTLVSTREIEQGTICFVRLDEWQDTWGDSEWYWPASSVVVEPTPEDLPLEVLDE